MVFTNRLIHLIDSRSFRPYLESLPNTEEQRLGTNAPSFVGNVNQDTDVLYDYINPGEVQHNVNIRNEGLTSSLYEHGNEEPFINRDTSDYTYYAEVALPEVTNDIPIYSNSANFQDPSEEIYDTVAEYSTVEQLSELDASKRVEKQTDDYIYNDLDNYADDVNYIPPSDYVDITALKRNKQERKSLKDSSQNIQSVALNVQIGANTTSHDENEISTSLENKENERASFEHEQLQATAMRHNTTSRSIKNDPRESAKFSYGPNAFDQRKGSWETPGNAANHDTSTPSNEVVYVNGTAAALSSFDTMCKTESSNFSAVITTANQFTDEVPADADGPEDPVFNSAVDEPLSMIKTSTKAIVSQDNEDTFDDKLDYDETLPVLYESERKEDVPTALFSTIGISHGYLTCIPPCHICEVKSPVWAALKFKKKHVIGKPAMSYLLINIYAYRYICYD